jgi:hypothetical protein
MKVLKVFLSLKWYEFSEWFKEYWIGIAIAMWFVGWCIVGGVSNVWWFTDPRTPENIARGFGCGLLLGVCAVGVWGLVSFIKWIIKMIKENWKKAKAIIAFENKSKEKCPGCNSLLTLHHKGTYYWLYCETCKVPIKSRWV